MTLIDQIAETLLALPRRSKRAMALALDAIACVFAVWVAYYLRLGFFVSLSGSPRVAVALSILLALPTFYMVGLYQVAFRRVGVEILPRIALASTIYGVAFAVLIATGGFSGVPRTVGMIQPVLLFLLVFTARLAVGALLGGRAGPRVERRRGGGRMLIYGAGSSGRQLAAALADRRSSDVLGFLDDDRSLRGARIHGLKVHRPADLPGLVERQGVTDVLLALPSVPQSRRNEIIAGLRSSPVTVRTLPGLLDLAHGHVDAGDIRELTIEDLLSRDTVDATGRLGDDRIRGRTVLVSGAGGSIGSELCRQIITAGPKRLLLLENSEFALYAIHRSLTAVSDLEIVPLLGSVVDTNRLAQILDAWSPDTVFHAAAFKHVPLVEHNVLEGLRNNALGTLAMAEMAVAHGVRDFVLVSTDKAVRPTNIMGATKRLAELILQGLASEDVPTRFSMVRFGNVLGSSGSVVPLFREQIRQGGPITVTDREVTRYFMTIPEAAQLVVQASAMAQGGEVFVLEMGEPVRIVDLARNMVELCGLTVRSDERPDGDIAIETVGLRPGEKLYEELLIGNDPRPTAHPRIMMATEHRLDWATLRPRLAQLEGMVTAGSVAEARDLLCELVAEFTPVSDVVDWVAVQNASIATTSPVTVAALETR